MSITITPIPRLIDLSAPAFTLGTANAAGSAATAIASDSTLLVFDTTLPDAITLGQSGAVGSATVTSRRDHAHQMATVDAATQAQMETGTSTTVFVTPGRTQYHDGVAKAKGHHSGPGTMAGESYNLDTIVKNSTGNYTWTFTTDFSTLDYVVAGTNTSQNCCLHSDGGKAVGTWIELAFNSNSDETAQDGGYDAAFYGDQ
jgi:hypothetical protein